jgi:hypothetical protein
MPCHRCVCTCSDGGVRSLEAVPTPIHAAVMASNPADIEAALLRITSSTVAHCASVWPLALNVTAQVCFIRYHTGELRTLYIHFSSSWCRICNVFNLGSVQEL